MAKLLCVGGPSHGQRVEVDLRRGYIEVMQRPTISVIHAMVSYAECEDAVIPHSTYCVRSTHHTDSAPTEFLMPHRTGAAEALAKLLSDSARLEHLKKIHDESGINIIGR